MVSKLLNFGGCSEAAKQQRDKVLPTGPLGWSTFHSRTQTHTYMAKLGNGKKTGCCIGISLANINIHGSADFDVTVFMLQV